MKTAKLIVGIISIVLFLLIILQSCAAGIANTLSGSEEISGMAGFLLAILMLIAGIVGITTRSSRGGGITAGVFYIFGGLIALASYGSFADLQIWAWLSIFFGALYIVGSFKKIDKTHLNNALKEEYKNEDVIS